MDCNELPSSATVLALWGSASNNVYASTSGGEILKFNGTTWAYANVVSNSLWTIFGAAASDIYAAGTQGFVTRYNGTAWAVLPAPAAGLVTGIWMSGLTNVLAVGTDPSGLSGAASRFNGTAWQSLSPGTNRVLTSIWGPSVSDVYVTGDQGTLLRFNGTTFQTQTTGTTALLWAVSGSPNGVGGAFAVGINGTIVTGSSGAAFAGLSGSTAFGPQRASSLDPSAAAMTSRMRADRYLPGLHDALANARRGEARRLFFVTAAQGPPRAITPPGAAPCRTGNRTRLS